MSSYHVESPRGYLLPGVVSDHPLLSRGFVLRGNGSDVTSPESSYILPSPGPFPPTEREVDLFPMGPGEGSWEGSPDEPKDTKVILPKKKEGRFI